MRRWQRKWSLAAMVLAVAAAAVLQAGPAQSAPPTKETWQTAVAALQTQIDSQNSVISALQSTVNNLQATVTNQAIQIGTLQTQSTNFQNNPVLALGPYVSVVPGTINGLNGPHVIFTGANVHVRSGAGSTDENFAQTQVLSGLGNLVVGYNEDFTNPQIRIRTGSHNFIVGPQHSYRSYGGLVAGYQNLISGPYASVSAGTDNTASAESSSISGGTFNIASGYLASVSGGERNSASGHRSWVTGGFGNTASGVYSSASSGEGNTASGRNSSVSGGYVNTASGNYSSVSGGGGNSASGTGSSVTGGYGIINDGHFINMP
jgi:hypothetical protein